MGKDKYAIELERVIWNWYYGGDAADPFPVHNAFIDGLNNNMRVLVPIVQPDETDEGCRDNKHYIYTELNIDGLTVTLINQKSEEVGKYRRIVLTSEDVILEDMGCQFLNTSICELLCTNEYFEDCVGIIINPHDKKLLFSKFITATMQAKLPSSRIVLIKSSVMNMHVDAIVNATNNSLFGDGADGAIFQAAGPQLLAACKRLNSCLTGEAKITLAYELNNVDFIIHTVGPVYSGSEEDIWLLRACYLNSLDLALANNCKSIAFPGISTGAYGFPVAEAADIALMTVDFWLDRHPDIMMNIYFCCYHDKEFKTYKKLVNFGRVVEPAHRK